MNRQYVAMIVAMVGLAGSTYAQDKNNDRPQTDRPQSERSTVQPRHDDMKKDWQNRQDSMAGESILVPVSRAIGTTVTGNDGARLGQVNDVVVRGSSGRVVYVLVTKGFKATSTSPEERVAAVPFGAFRWDDERKVLTLPVSEEQFKAAPSMEGNQWQTIAQPAQATAAYKYFNVDEDRMTLDRKPYHIKRSGDTKDWDRADKTRDSERRDSDKDRREADKERREADKDRREAEKNMKPRDGEVGARSMGEEGYLFTTSEIRNHQLRSRDGRDLGLIDDVVFDAPSGQIAFLVLSPSSELQVGDGRIGAPWPLFEVDSTGRLYATELDRDVLRASPRLTQADWAELRINGYTDDMYKRYGYEPVVWNRGMGTVSTRESGEWRDKYRAAMKSGTPRTISGKIESIDDEASKVGNGRVVTMNVKTNEGETVKVHTAPQAYLDEHQLGLHKGDSVTVVGKMAEIDGKRCLCATEVAAADGKRVVLFSSDGETR